MSVEFGSFSKRRIIFLKDLQPGHLTILESGLRYSRGIVYHRHEGIKGLQVGLLGYLAANCNTEYRAP